MLPLRETDRYRSVEQGGSIAVPRKQEQDIAKKGEYRQEIPKGRADAGRGSCILPLHT